MSADSSPLRFRGAGPKIALALASSLLGLGLAEWVLRPVYPVGVSTTTEHRIPDPELGWVLEPGARFELRREGRPVEVAYNRWGFRDLERNFRPEPTRPRILILGDSFMEAYSVSLEDSFARRLESALSALGVEREVVNLGVGGYGTLQEALAFERWGGALDPSLVLLAFHAANDVRNNSLELESMLSRGSMKALSRPFLDPRSDSWRISPVDFEGARRRFLAASQANRQLGARWLRSSSLAQALHAVFARGRAAVSRRARGERAPDGRRRDRALALFGVDECEPSEAVERAWRQTERILERLGSGIERSGAAWMIFSVPARHQVEPAALRRAETDGLGPGRLCLRESPSLEWLSELSARLEIPYLDLLPRFREEVAKGRGPLYLREDGHWNASAHALAAEMLAQEVLARGLLSGKAAGFEPGR